MADEKVCRQFQPHTWKKDLCVNCMQAQSAHKHPLQGSVTAKKKLTTTNGSSPYRNKEDFQTSQEPGHCRAVGGVSSANGHKPESNKDKAEGELTGKKQNADPTHGLDKKQCSSGGSANQLIAQATKREVVKRSAAGSNKPAVATKPRHPITKLKQSPDKQACDPPTSQDKDIQPEESPSITSSATGAKPKATPRKVSHAPGLPRSEVTTEKQDEVGKKSNTPTSRVHGKGLNSETNFTPEMKRQHGREVKLSQSSGSARSKDRSLMTDSKGKETVSTSHSPSSSQPVLPGGVSVQPPSGGGHYYHKYDITASLQRRMNKALDKRMDHVKDELLVSEKSTLVTPYTVVDVTNVRKECEQQRPPQLPPNPPPERTFSEPTSRESTPKYSKNKSRQEEANSGNAFETSTKGEPLPSPKLPIILQEEAQKMKEESRSPPPHRKVPIIIRPQYTDNSDTYEPIEDYQTGETSISDNKNEAESMAGLAADADFSDYTDTDVGCLFFAKQSKSRASANKTNAFETKMAALANLDLLKGIASKVHSQDVSMEQGHLDGNVDSGSSNKVEEQDASAGHADGQKTSKKGGKSFFKKLLKIGSKESTASSREINADDHETNEVDTTSVDAMSCSGCEEPAGSSASAEHGALVRQDRMLSEVQRVLAQRQLSAPDICRELTDLKNMEQKPADISPTSVTAGQTGQQAMRTRKKLNVAVQPVSLPQLEEKINNIKQAQEMALSLGIDKESPRHKIGEVAESNSHPTAPPRPPTQMKPTLPTGIDHTFEQFRDVPTGDTYALQERSVTVAETLEQNEKEPCGSSLTKHSGGLSPSGKPAAVSTKPNIPAKLKKVTESGESGQKVLNSPNLPCVILPEFVGEADIRESNTDSSTEKTAVDSFTSPTSSESSTVSFAADSGATSPQPTSPTSEMSSSVRTKKSKLRSDMKTGKIARSKMPAPPPPPPQSALPSGSIAKESQLGTEALSAVDSASQPSGSSPFNRTSPDHKSGVKRATGLTHTDISAPILTSPELMSRSFSTPGDEVADEKDKSHRVDSIKKHSRNKTVSEGIVVEDNTSVGGDGEAEFGSLGRLSSKFRNRALPPTPSQLGHGKMKSTSDSQESSKRTVSLIQENEYEMVSLDSDTDNGEVEPESAERPAYEDIDDGGDNDDADGNGGSAGDGNIIYNDPADLQSDSEEENNNTGAAEVELPAAGRGTNVNQKRSKNDGYLEPVSATNEEDKCKDLFGKKQMLSGTVQMHQDLYLTVYTNTDVCVYGRKPAETIKEAFNKMSLHNVDTLLSRAKIILDQFFVEPMMIKEPVMIKWNDYVLKDSVPKLQVGDIAFYAARNSKVSPYNCYLMASHLGLSSIFTESFCYGSITPVKVFKDSISTEFFVNQTKPGHYHLPAVVKTSIGVLDYMIMDNLDTTIHNMDCLFATDLNEYERLVCFWITHITGAILDISMKWPHLKKVSCDHVIAVRVPSCEQIFPVLVIPDFICSKPHVQNQASGCDWSQIGSDIIRILFRLLRLVYSEKSKDPAGKIPVRSKYSTGLRAFVQEILKEKTSSNGIVLGKFLLETMLWGPCSDDLKQLMSADNQDLSFQIWIELRRNLAINDLAKGCYHNTLDSANMLTFLCSITVKLLMDTTRILQMSQ